MTDMTVRLVDHMGSDLTVVNAARVSFKKKTDHMRDEDRSLIKYLARNGHWSPFAHTCVTLHIKAPIFVARQLAKHQVGLVWNEVSRRYIDEEPEFYVPTHWRGRAPNVKQGSSEEAVMTEDDVGASDYVRYASDIYKYMLKVKVAPEMARILLPQNTMTEWWWTGSVMAFARVCTQRLDPHAQLETRKVAEQISGICHDLFPASWEALVEQ